MLVDKENGCYVTTRKALTVAITAIFTLIVVIVFMYYYPPNQKIIKNKVEENDIEVIIKGSIENKVQKNIRLPKDLYPIHYTLRIHPIFNETTGENASFTGYVKILINCVHPTNAIILHWDNINIEDEDIQVTTENLVNIPRFPHFEENNNTTTAESLMEYQTTPLMNLDNASGSNEDNATLKTIEEATEFVPVGAEELAVFEAIPILKIIRDSENLKLNILLEEHLKLGHNYTVEIHFNGEINEKLIGFYKSKYVDLTGQSRWLLTTQFQTIFARKLFPSFDEPGFKSIFKISIARKSEMVAISNMPIYQTEVMREDTEWVWDHFYSTFPIPTYLIAITVCDYSRISLYSTQFNTQISVWAPKEELPKAKYALDTAVEIFDFLNSYFKVKYPLPKLDLVSIPSLGKVAMENWGAISFGKGALLYEPESDSFLLKPYIFKILSHQISHQWLGNLVTIGWWSEFWFKEGCANFMAAILEENLRGYWQTSYNLPILGMHHALSSDSLKSSQSLQIDIIDNEQIEQMTDTIVLDKGTSLLRMLNYTMPKDKFRNGIDIFLKTFLYKTANAEDLWDILSNLNNDLVFPKNSTAKSIMKGWTEQSGYPIISVNTNTSDGRIIIGQSRFVEKEISESSSLWVIPLNFMTKENHSLTKLWINNKTESIIVNMTSWVLFNVHQSGFYRVNYDKRNWDNLNKQLIANHTEIPLVNRAQLLDDAFELAKLGNLNYSTPFKLTQYMGKNETEYIVWRPAIENLKYIRTIINNYEYSGIFDTFLRNLVTHRFNTLGTRQISTESLNDKFLRFDIVDLGCQLFYEPCVEWAKQQLNNWMQEADPDKKNPIPHAYRRIVQCIGIKKGGRREWIFLWKRAHYPLVSPKDLKAIYLTLGCSRDPLIIKKYLHLSLTGNVSLENVPLVWQSLDNPVALRTAFAFLRLNWDTIYEKYKDIYFVLGVIISDFLSYLSTEIDLEDLTYFYKNHIKDLDSYANVIQGTVDKIKQKIEWKKRHLRDVVNWLKRN